MASAKKGGLGRGLGALIPGLGEGKNETKLVTESAHDENRVLHLDPSNIEPNPMQPRIVFNEEALQELAESIRRDGVQEPVIVRKKNNVYELVSGERRVRASKMAGMKTVPAICYDVSDSDMLKLGLIENIQREDLNAIELAGAYKRLCEEFGWSQEELADQVGKKRATVANILRLLKLPQEVQESVVDGSITMGHARALLSLESASEQTKACKKVISGGLSVRQTEAYASKPKKKAQKQAKPKDPNIESLEDDLRRKLGARVNLRQNGPKRGKIEIEYSSLDELDRIIGVIKGAR